jgi:hypothetical protein
MADGLIADARRRQLSGLKQGKESPSVYRYTDGDDDDDENGRTRVHLARLVSVSPDLMGQALALKSRHPEHWADVEKGAMTVGRAYDLALGGDEEKRKYRKSRAQDPTLAPIPAWQTPRPKGKNIVAWQQAFRAQAERARDLFDQIAIERQKRIHAEGSLPDKARAMSLKDIGQIKKQAADDIDLMRRRCMIAAGYLSGAVKMGPQISKETKLNPQQWQAFLAQYKEDFHALTGVLPPVAAEKE